jgi:hypothetical protein
VRAHVRAFACVVRVCWAGVFGGRVRRARARVCVCVWLCQGGWAGYGLRLMAASVSFLFRFPGRHRASFSVVLDGDPEQPTGVALSFADGHAAVQAEQVPMMSEEIQAAMRHIEQQSASAMGENRVLWRLLCSVHFHSTSQGKRTPVTSASARPLASASARPVAGNLLIHLVYSKAAGRPAHRKGDGKMRVAPPSSPTDAWLPAAHALRSAILAALERELPRRALERARRVDVVGHWKGHCVSADSAYVEEEFSLGDGRVLKYTQVGMAFSNPNTDVARASLEWLCESAKLIGARCVCLRRPTPRGAGGPLRPPAPSAWLLC